MTKVIIVDDHDLFRMVLRMSFSDYPDVDVSGEAGSGAELFALLGATPCDLVLLDVGLPDMSGVEIAGRLHRDYPAIKILVISAENTNDTIQALLETGIEGFISKQSGVVDEIIRAIRAIMAGDEYYGSDVATMMYKIFVSKKHNPAIVLPEFTTREIEIIELCRDGLITKEIAQRLGISIYTVRNHKTNIFQKLGLNNSMEMVRYALKHKIIRP